MDGGLMPFTKQSNGKYKSPSGRTFTKKAVQAYYASDGFTEPVKKSHPVMEKAASKLKSRRKNA